MNRHSENQQDRPAAATRATADRFADLWTDYLEGQLSPTGMADLEKLLAGDEQLTQRAADLYQTHRRLGLLAERRLAAAGSEPRGRFVADVMAGLPAGSGQLTDRVMADIMTRPSKEPMKSNLFWQRQRLTLVSGGLMAAVIVAAVLATRQSAVPVVLKPSLSEQAEATRQADQAAVRFASLARARFLNRETPRQQSVADLEQTYVLSHGLVELAFPSGATAILEGPAAFRVCGEACLAVDAGRCSVHAPDGAEGFRVETPASHVIDRGTRFVVHVDETSGTEVQVIEGAADLLVTGDPTGRIYRLASGETARHDPATAGQPVVATVGNSGPSGYRPRLPDRLIRYTASLAHPADAAAGDTGGPGIDTLKTITVQRDGRVLTYQVDDLIGVKLLHMRATRNKNNLTLPGGNDVPVGPLKAAATRQSVLETDRLLTTGVINPGGAAEPLTSDPLLSTVVEATDGLTPGLAFSFNRPVQNDAGPDLVLFELQMLTDPPESDAFRLSPLRFSAELRTYTVNAYDIDSTSPESQLLARFRLFTFSQLPGSLDDLLTLPTNAGNLLPVRARANAVAIDLSDLGYTVGATCDGLFLQDADDDNTTVDPVFIAGLPPLERDMP